MEVGYINPITLEPSLLSFLTFLSPALRSTKNILQPQLMASVSAWGLQG
jgi:hypothetical protein